MFLTGMTVRRKKRFTIMTILDVSGKRVTFGWSYPGKFDYGLTRYELHSNKVIILVFPFSPECIIAAINKLKEYSENILKLVSINKFPVYDAYR